MTRKGIHNLHCFSEKNSLLSTLKNTQEYSSTLKCTQVYLGIYEYIWVHLSTFEYIWAHLSTLKLCYNDPFYNKILAIKNLIWSPSVVSFIVKSPCNNKPPAIKNKSSLQIRQTEVSVNMKEREPAPVWISFLLKCFVFCRTRKRQRWIWILAHSGMLRLGELALSMTNDLLFLKLVSNLRGAKKICKQQDCKETHCFQKLHKSEYFRLDYW
jgi:hypothetical protein